MNVKDFYPIEIRPAANGVIVQEQSDPRCAPSLNRTFVFTTIEQLNEFLFGHIVPRVPPRPQRSKTDERAYSQGSIRP